MCLLEAQKQLRLLKGKIKTEMSLRSLGDKEEPERERMSHNQKRTSDFPDTKSEESFKKGVAIVSIK